MFEITTLDWRHGLLNRLIDIALQYMLSKACSLLLQILSLRPTTIWADDLVKLHVLKIKSVWWQRFRYWSLYLETQTYALGKTLMAGGVSFDWNSKFNAESLMTSNSNRVTCHKNQRSSFTDSVRIILARSGLAMAHEQSSLNCWISLTWMSDKNLGYVLYSAGFSINKLWKQLLTFLVPVSSIADRRESTLTHIEVGS